MVVSSGHTGCTESIKGGQAGYKMQPHYGESYVIPSQCGLLHHSGKDGPRLHASTWINPSLLILSPETILYISSQKGLVQEIRSYTIVGRDGRGRNPEMGMLLGNQNIAGSHYGYHRHHRYLRKSEIHLVPLSSCRWSWNRNPVGKRFWGLWPSGFYFL